MLNFCEFLDKKDKATGDFQLNPKREDKCHSGKDSELKTKTKQFFISTLHILEYNLMSV